MEDLRRPPTAPGDRPVVGHTLSVLRGPLEALTTWGERTESLLRLRVAGRPFCLVTTPEGLEQVLVSDPDQYEKADIVRDRLGRLQGGSLVLLDGEEWRERRELLQSGFGPEQVRRTGPLTTQYATAMVDEWPTDRPVRVGEAVTSLSLSILARALFGLDLRGERTPVHEAADDIMARMDLRSPSAYLPEWVPTPTNYRFRQATATLHDRLDEVVAARTTDDNTPATNLFSVMGEAGLPQERIRDELTALLFAGYDSTATALSLTLGLLGTHPQVQADLRDELDAVLGSDPPSPDDLADLPLLDAVVRESLRLYPPQYLLFRQPVDPVTLQGYRVEAGTTLLLPPWVVQRHPEYWETPLSFRPSRWLGDGTTPPAPDFAYIPYGGGQRRCLGAHLANQTIKLVVAVVCQRRRLESRDTVSVRAGPTLMPAGVDVWAYQRD